MTAPKKPKLYSVIYADPPWSYNDKMGDRKSFSVVGKYETQKLSWIENLPIKDIAGENSALFLWVVSPLLPEGFEVLKKWGFKYKTVAFCWVKETPLFNSVANLGRWTMGGMELCLLGVKGKPQRIERNIRQLCFSERRDHSRKPNEIRSRIVKLMGNVSRIELFARERHEGWDSFGNEIEGGVELSGTFHDPQG